MHPSTELLIDLALSEDTAFGDLTSEALFSPSDQSTARIVAREPLVISGLAVAQAVFKRVDAQLQCLHSAADGEFIEAGACVLELQGATISLLTAERTALNFLQRLSGIATLARRYAQAANACATGVRIADTRKTTPGWRGLEKRAVRHGGCFNHRFSLGEHVMLKDNHIAAAGSIDQAVQAARRAAPHLCRIEVEADTLAQVREAVDAGADVILLDNMRPATIESAVELIAGRAIVEVSGGVTLDTLADYAQPGVDVISIGALTHSANAVDLGMELTPERPAGG